MLGLKSFRSAAITLAGVELAHRVLKKQYSLPKGMTGRVRSLKEMWDAALADSGVPICRDGDRPSPMHQNSANRFQPVRRLLAAGVDPSLMRRQLRGIEGDEPEVGCGIPGNWLHAAQAV